jgi:hypothetical protein
LIQVATALPAALDNGHDYINRGNFVWGEEGKTAYSTSILNVGDLQRTSWWNPFATRRISVHKFRTEESDYFPVGPDTELTAILSGDPADISSLELIALIDADGKDLTRNNPEGTGGHAKLEANSQDMLAAVLRYISTEDVAKGLRAVPTGPQEPLVPEYR